MGRLMFQKNNLGGLTNILWLAEKKWGGLKAQLLLIAQGNALGGRIPRLIHLAFLRWRKNATRLERVIPAGNATGRCPS